MSLLWSLYRLVTPAVGAAAPALGALLPPEERALWGERLGHPLAPAGAVDAWIHSASMGEAVAAEALGNALRQTRQEARFLFTATTRTGRERLARLGPAALAPLDTPQAAGAFLRAARPPRVFLIETELWPRWLLCARERGIPVSIASARLSAGSARRYAWLGDPLRALVGGLAAVLCQSEADRDRWLSLGARPERAAVVGNLKFDALPEPAADRVAARAALDLDPSRPLLVLASLRPGEAKRLAAAWSALSPGTRQLWQVAAVPRHPHAARTVREEAEQAGAMLVSAGVPPLGAWRWDDRPGVLASYYAAADAAFVGGSLVPLGGHNPLEPAAAGAAVIVGPFHEAQAPAMEALRRADAVLVADDRGLVPALRLVLEDEGRRGEMSRAGLAAARAARGAGVRAVEKLREWCLWPPA